MSETNDLSPDILEQVKKCAAVLRLGGIAAYPTDTVYGLGADIHNDQAVAKVFAVKRRPLNLPLPVLICDQSQLAELTEFVPASAGRLIAAFWPGALTIVFNKAPSFNSLVTAGSSKVAVRMPGHAITLRLIKEAGFPIVGTSANLHGRNSILNAEEVRSQLGAGIDCILDGGTCPGGTESTIVDVTNGALTVQRKGAIPEEALMDLRD